MTKRKPVQKSLFNQGYDSGFNKGYDRGYRTGWGAGSAAYSQPFAGTSIVIATYNQKNLLQQCIESIEAYTPEAHEIIVIDNASRDGTAAYLQSLGGKVRYKVMESNLGFAGGMNQGLMMARGSTILLLNNDTVVTKHWLRNLLGCLHGSPGAGLVGPMTNYISGEQLLETSYQTLEEMHAFAEAHNVPDSGKWRTTGRMTGFCVLMTRQAFERIGYFDEGFEIGNCEDDDYSIRARLLGMELVIAQDTFIHHVGSASMKALGERFESVYGNNLLYYSEKWGDTHTLIQEVKRLEESGQKAERMVDYYPTHVLIQGPGQGMYWIENGLRHLVHGTVNGEPVRVSRTDLRGWPLGPELIAEELEAKVATLASIPSAYGPIAEGVLLRSWNGTVYQSDRGALRPVTGKRTLLAWRLDGRTIYPLTEEIEAMYRKGLPLLSPAALRQGNL